MPSVVLLVEDSPGDASLVRAALRAPGFAAPPHVVWVGCVADAVSVLRTEHVDCVLLDLGLPDATGLDVLDAVVAVAPDVAVVVLTGLADRDLALEAVHRGAQDYLLKSDLDADVLERAVRYAIERSAVRAALARREEERRALVESLSEGVVVHNAAGEVIECNAAAVRMLGLTAGEMRGRTPLDPRWGAVREDGSAFPGAEHPASVALRTADQVTGVVMGMDHNDGRRRWIEVNAAPLRLPGEAAPYAAVASFRDVTARREAEAEVRVQAALLDAAGNAIVATDPDGTIRYWNTGAEAMYGWPAAEVLGRPAADLPAFRGLREQAAQIGAALDRGASWTGDVDAERRDGTPLKTLVTETPLYESGRLVMVIAVATDITARRAAEDTARRLSAIVDSSDDAIIGRSLDGIVMSWNPAAERLSGYTAAEAIGQPAVFTMPAERRPQVAAVIEAIARGETVPPYETVVLRKDGARVDISLAVSPIRGDNGEVVGSSAIARDITEQVRLRRAAEEDRRRLAEAQAVAGLGSFEHVLDDGSLAWSEETYRIFGLPVGARVSERVLYALIHPDDHEAVRAACDRAITRAHPVEVPYRISRPDGDLRYVTARFRAHREPDGRPSRLVGTVLDVTDVARADDERRAAEHRFQLGFERAAAGTAIADLDGRLVRVNAALCRLLGRREEDLVGRHPDEFLHPANPAGPTPFTDAVTGEGSAGVEVRFARPNGDGVDALVDVAVVAGQHGEPEYLFAQLLDITRRKRAERALAHQALHDSLTGLPNRLLMLDRLDHALAQRDRRSGPVVVLLVDLDQFKLVNDGMGHSAGDALLVDAAARLAAAVRPGDTVCRLGGDEFVILCEDVDGVAGAQDIADRACAAFTEPFVVERRELFVTASVGVTLSTGASTAHALLRDADAAMYRAKERGRARVELFDEALRARVEAKLATATALRHALQGDELVVHYQPIVALADEQLVGFEALVRWNDPARGLVTPAEFIAVAEETGLIVPIGEHVLREAAGQLAEWTATFPGCGELSVSVNVSARQLVDPGFVPTVAGILRASGIAPHRLHLEITETVLMDDVEGSIEVLRALAALGVALEIDDFGTGYSSLSYLKRLPVDTLKVDRSFVAGLGDDSEDSSIVTAITALGHALGLRLHAEGVETEAQFEAVRGLGCDVAQGFLWSPPLDARMAEPWLRRRPERILSLLPAQVSVAGGRSPARTLPARAARRGTRRTPPAS